MRKHTLGALLCVLAIGMANSAQAADIQVTRVQSGVPVDTSGGQMTLFCAHMDNGQALYLMGSEEELSYKFEDVNFDGYEDFVTFPVLGARNIFEAFYIWQPETQRYAYAPVFNGQLCNVELDRERELVISQVSDGIRNCQRWVFTWTDGHLTPLREMRVCDYEEFAETDSGYTITQDRSRYVITLRDYTQNVNGEMIAEQVYPADETGEMDAERLAQAHRVLMEGL